MNNINKQLKEYRESQKEKYKESISPKKYKNVKIKIHTKKCTYESSSDESSSDDSSSDDNCSDDSSSDDNCSDDNCSDNQIIKKSNKKNNNKITDKKTIRKKNIPSTVKRLVWNKYIGENIGKYKCYCCKLTDITQLSFHCGHVISEKNA
jgi:hypothetical protein